MNALNSIRSTNVFLLKYTLGILCIFGLLFGALSCVRNRVGAIPHAIGFLFFYFAPGLMWSVPVLSGVLGGWTFGKSAFPDASLAARVLVGVLSGCLYSGIAAMIVFVAYEAVYAL